MKKQISMLSLIALLFMGCNDEKTNQIPTKIELKTTKIKKENKQETFTKEQILKKSQIENIEILNQTAQLENLMKELGLFYSKDQNIENFSINSSNFIKDNEAKNNSFQLGLDEVEFKTKKCLKFKIHNEFISEKEKIPAYISIEDGDDANSEICQNFKQNKTYEVYKNAKIYSQKCQLQADNKCKWVQDKEIPGISAQLLMLAQYEKEVIKLSNDLYEIINDLGEYYIKNKKFANKITQMTNVKLDDITSEDNLAKTNPDMDYTSQIVLSSGANRCINLLIHTGYKNKNIEIPPYFEIINGKEISSEICDVANSYEPIKKLKEISFIPKNCKPKFCNPIKGIPIK